MKRKMSLPALALLTMGLLPFMAAAQPNPQSANGEDHTNNESVQALKLQIQALEATIAAMQRRIDDLELNSCSKTPIVPLSFPETHMPFGPEIHMPSGARPFQFNGMEFWEIPIALDQHQDTAPNR